MNEPQDLANLAREKDSDFRIMVVDSVQEDGSVNLEYQGSIFNDISANASYMPREEGDVVLVLNSGRSWRVIDKVGSGEEEPEEDPGVPVTMTFGPSSPGSGWAQASTIYVKDNEIYIQTGSGPDPDPGGGSPPVASKPKPVKLKPSSQALYQSGKKRSLKVGIAQGAWPTYPHPYTGIWLYGKDKIKNACAGKTVDKIQVRVARTKKYHGASGKVKPSIGTHNENSAPSGTPSLSRKFDGAGLGMGSAKWYTLPSSAAKALANGSAQGLGIGYGSGKSRYMIASAGSGEIKITFK